MSWYSKDIEKNEAIKWIEPYDALWCDTTHAESTKLCGKI